MQVRDTSSGYGLISRLLHWIMAAGVIALFALGWWMVGLDYYNPYYTSAPYVHKSVGVLLLILLLPRLLWRVSSIKPSDAELTDFERRTAPMAHWLLYLLMGAVMVSGYLIPTAKGQPVDVFGIFLAPALFTGEQLEDIAGWVHRYTAYAIMIVAGIHTIAALKHHFHDKSSILARMWSGPRAP